MVSQTDMHTGSGSPDFGVVAVTNSIECHETQCRARKVLAM